MCMHALTAVLVAPSKMSHDRTAHPRRVATDLATLMPTILLLLLLCIPANVEAAGAVYIQHDSSLSCLCHQNVASKEVHCALSLASNVSKSLEYSDEVENDNSPGDCKHLPVMIISKLTIDCSNFTFQSQVDLHEMTFSHTDSGSNSSGRYVYPPYHVELIHCRIEYEKLSFGQLSSENASTHEDIQLAMFGPVQPRLAALYTETLTYNSTFHPDDCKLITVLLRSCIVVYFPLYLNMKCAGLTDMQLIDTPLDVISASNMLGVMSLQRFVASNSSLSEAAENIYDLALDYLNHYLDDANTSRSLNANDTNWLRHLHRQFGRLNWQKVIFNASDSSGHDFTFNFAKRQVKKGADAQDKEAMQQWELIPSQLSLLDLSFNRLTKIPKVLSLLGNLYEVNLSHNAIDSLYDYNMCWPPSNEQSICYWFRAPKDSLKVLDLSHNSITFIGAVSPWHEVKLQYLDLSHNKIKSVNAMAFSASKLTASLLELNMDHNRLQIFELESLRRLEKLWVRHNHLEQISRLSIPQSAYLSKINLTNNSISDIDCGCFESLTKLYSLDLRHNYIREWHSDYFKMSNRSNEASRVWLFLSDQRVPQICQCDHVYVASQLEAAQQADICSMNYVYPQFTYKQARQYTCTFFNHDNVRYNMSKSLSSSSTSDFICPYFGYKEVKVPPEYCSAGTKYCTTKCISYCSCWYSLSWTYSDINCDNITSDPFNLPIRIPAKELSLNNVTGLGISGKFSHNSLNWAMGNESASRGLLYLSMVGSHILEIEDFAFSSYNYSIEMLNLSYNSLRVINSRTFAGLEHKLKQLELQGNQIRPFDLSIFNSFQQLFWLSLRNNSWVCSCRSDWLSFHSQLIDISQLGQFVRDFNQIECAFDEQEFNQDYAEYEEYAGDSSGKRLNLSAPYLVNDHGALQRLCNAMATYQDSRRQAVVKWTLTAIGIALATILLILLVAKRHKVYGAVEMFFILKYMQNSRRQQAIGGGDAYDFDVFFLADQQDEPILAKVLQDLDSAFRFYRLSSSQAIDYAVHSGSGRLQQTRFESVSDGVRFSRTVIVLLSQKFLHSCFHDLLQVVDEMSISGRGPSDHVVLLKLSRDLTHREARSYGQQVEGAISALFSRSVLHGSTDWQYKVASLVCRAKFHSTADAADATSALMSVPAAAAATTGEGQPLLETMVDGGGGTCSVELAGLSMPQLEWAPHTGGEGCDVMVLARLLPTDGPEQGQLFDSLIEECSSRHLKLGTCAPELADRFPDSFERVFTGLQEVPPRFLKRTRQFVIVLGPALARWFDENRDPLEDLFDLQLATRVTRRLLVFLDDRVSLETGDVYRQLANRHLAGQPLQNDFSLADGAAGGDGLWKRALYRRVAV